MSTEFDIPAQRDIDAMLALKPLNTRPDIPDPPLLCDQATAPGEWRNPETLTLPLENLLNLLPSSCREALENNLDHLQEQVLDRVYEVFQPAGINLNERLVLAVTPQGELLTGEHSQAELIMSLLSDNPDIIRDLRTMAALSLALEGISSLDKARETLEERAEGENPFFQACFKGGLSHFHLI